MLAEEFNFRGWATSQSRFLTDESFTLLVEPGDILIKMANTAHSHTITGKFC